MLLNYQSADLCTPSLVKKVNSEPIDQEGVEYVTELPADF